jgi:hypothetical protein
MKEPLIEQVERTLAEAIPASAPAELRGAVLTGVRRELRRARWDRGAMRTAAALLAFGVGMNVLFALRPILPMNLSARLPMNLSASDDLSDDVLVEATVMVAEATDAETARRFARHMVVIGGRSPSDELLATLDAAIEQRLARSVIGDG